MEYNVTYRKKDKGIQAIVSYKTNTGKWKQKSKQGFEDSRKGKYEAKEWVKDTLTDLEEVVKDKNSYSQITYKDFVEEYLSYKKSTITYNTYLLYKTSLEKFKILDDMKLVDITPLATRKAYDSVKNETENKSVGKYYGILRNLFSCAINDFDIIKTNPCKLIKNKENKTEKPALNINEQYKLINSLKDYYNQNVYIVSLLALRCGLRQGEALGLTWNDIDVKKLELDINKQWKKNKDGIYDFGDTKNKKNRKVPIKKDVLKELFKFKTNNPISYDNRVVGCNQVSEQCRRAYRLYGFNISVHILRHTYATNLIANGVDFRTAADLLGHSVKMTMEIYSHVTNDMLEKAKNIINFI